MIADSEYCLGSGGSHGSTNGAGATVIFFSSLCCFHVRGQMSKQSPVAQNARWPLTKFDAQRSFRMWWMFVMCLLSSGMSCVWCKSCFGTLILRGRDRNCKKSHHNNLLPASRVGLVSVRPSVCLRLQTHINMWLRDNHSGTAWLLTYVSWHVFSPP